MTFNTRTRSQLFSSGQVDTSDIKDGAVSLSKVAQEVVDYVDNSVANVQVDLTGYATETYVDTTVSSKQDTLVSGTNIKTINGESILGSSDITILSGSGGGVTAYDYVANLPVTASIGDLAYVTDNKRLYLWNGAVWFHILTAETPNTAPFITQNPKFGYSLSPDGTPLSITLNATDPEGTAITWSYTVTGGTLGNTATVEINNNVVTITPSTNPADEGEFELTFTASDGLNIANTTPAYFKLLFSYSWLSGTMQLEDSINNPTITNSTYGAGTAIYSFGYSIIYMRNNELLISAPGNGVIGVPGGIYIYDTSNVPATLIGYFALQPASGVGSSFGIQFDYNDNWLAVGTTENASTDNAAYISMFKRNSDGSWPIDGNGKLIRHSVIGSMTNATSVLGPISLDKTFGVNRLVVSTGSADDINIYAYNSNTNQWVSEFYNLQGALNHIDISIAGNYIATIGYANATLTLYYYVNGGWTTAVPVALPLSRLGHVKIFSYQSEYYILVVGSGEATTNDSYKSWIYKIDQTTNQIDTAWGSKQSTVSLSVAVGNMEPMANYPGATNTLISGTSTTNLYTKKYVDSYLTGSILQVCIGIFQYDRCVTREYDLTTHTWSDPNTKTSSLLIPQDNVYTGFGCSVAMDPYSGKLAVSNTAYSNMAGKVWIFAH